MCGKKKHYGSKFKARVALESIKGEKTAAELASQYGVHAKFYNEERFHQSLSSRIPGEV